MKNLYLTRTPAQFGHLLHIAAPFLCAATLLLFSTLSLSAQSLQFAKSMGGSSNDYGMSIAVDGSGNSYITGYFAGTAGFSTSIREGLNPRIGM